MKIQRKIDRLKLIFDSLKSTIYTEDEFERIKDLIQEEIVNEVGCKVNGRTYLKNLCKTIKNAVKYNNANENGCIRELSVHFNEMCSNFRHDVLSELGRLSQQVKKTSLSV